MKKICYVYKIYRYQTNMILVYKCSLQFNSAHFLSVVPEKSFNEITGQNT